MRVDYTIPAWVAAQHGHLLSFDYPEEGPAVVAYCKCGWTTEMPVRVSDPGDAATDEWGHHVLLAISGEAPHPDEVAEHLGDRE